jgi:hypothetical protein
MHKEERVREAINVVKSVKEGEKKRVNIKSRVKVFNNCKNAVTKIRTKPN